MSETAVLPIGLTPTDEKNRITTRDNNAVAVQTIT